jgi:hypothetical protein
MVSIRHRNTPTAMLSELIRELGLREGRVLRILDVGSGSGTIWLQPDLRSTLETVAVDVTLFDAADTLDLVELPANFNHHRGIAPSDLSTFRNDAFDIVIAFDLIEHLSKQEGYLLLYQLDRLASQVSVVFTPTGFLWQPPSENNPFNAHISGWKPTELSRLGWRTTGLFGFRFLMGPYATPRLQAKTRIGKFLLQYLMAASQLLARRTPSAAFSFFGVKSVKNRYIERQV